MMPVNDDDQDSAIATRAAQVVSPFGKRDKPSAAVAVEGQRAVAEVQAALFIARENPRDEVSAQDRIINACSRSTLAEKAMYSYARGGTEITGPSIRLAEALAQSWGNIQFGIRELEQRGGESTVEAFAWDVQSNTRSVKVFQVPHVRHTKNGQTLLKDPRDIYELVANNGARRLRACILAIIPGDITEMAIQQCEVTLKSKIKVTPELIESLLAKFAEYGVPRKAIEAHIQRRLESITPALVVSLGKKLNSMKDGMSVPADWFEIEPATPAAGGTNTDTAREALQRAKKTSTKNAAAADRVAAPAPAAPPQPEVEAETAVADPEPEDDDDESEEAPPPPATTKAKSSSFLRNMIDSTAVECGIAPSVAADIERVTLNGAPLTTALAQKIAKAIRDVAEGAK